MSKSKKAKLLAKRTKYPDGEEYSEDEYGLLLSLMTKLSIDWDWLKEEDVTGRYMLDHFLEPDVIEKVIRKEDQREELDEMKKETESQERKKKINRKSRKSKLIFGAMFISVAALLLFVLPISCSKGKQKVEQPIAQQKVEVPYIPSGAIEMDDNSEYWWISENNTLYLGLGSITVLLIGIVIALRKKKTMDPRKNGNLGIILIIGGVIGLSTSFFQAYLAKNRNTLLETKYTRSLVESERKWIMDNTMAKCSANPVHDTALLRQYNEAIASLTYWMSKARYDSTREAGKNIGTDSILRAELALVRDSCKIAIVSLQKAINNVREQLAAQQRIALRMRDDSLLTENKVRELNAKLEAASAFVNPAHQLWFSSIGALGFLLVIIGVFWRKGRLLLIIIGATCLLVFGIYYWYTFIHGMKFCAQREIPVSNGKSDEEVTRKNTQLKQATDDSLSRVTLLPKDSVVIERKDTKQNTSIGDSLQSQNKTKTLNDNKKKSPILKKQKKPIKSKKRDRLILPRTAMLQFVPSQTKSPHKGDFFN